MKKILGGFLRTDYYLKRICPQRPLVGSFIHSRLTYGISCAKEHTVLSSYKSTIIIRHILHKNIDGQWKITDIISLVSTTVLLSIGFLLHLQSFKYRSRDYGKTKLHSLRNSNNKLLTVPSVKKEIINNFMYYFLDFVNILLVK